METKKFAYVDYTPIKKTISSDRLTSYNVVNLLAWELKKILSEDHIQFRIKKLDTFEKDVVRWYVNVYLKDADLSNETDVDIIKKLQDIREDIFHQKRIQEDIVLIKHIDVVTKTNDIQYIFSTLTSLCEKYWDTECIERKLFFRKQAEKCIKNLSDVQKYKRKKDFAYEEIIKPIILKP